MAKAISSTRLPIVVVLGATGAGKSKLALEIASKYNGEIISADSMQVYKKLDIITNKVTTGERKLCPHHMIDLISPLTTNYTVVDFRNTALTIIDEIFSRNRIPIIVGGTNYYIESLLWKMLIDPTEETGKLQNSTVLPPGDCAKKSDNFCQPPSECPQNSNTLPPGVQGETPVETSGECGVPQSPNKKQKLIDTSSRSRSFDREIAQNETTADLFKQLSDVDPERAKQVHPHDRRKILRSLEVFLKHGKKMSDYLKEQHQDNSLGGVSGPLRYPNPCVIWVKCQKQVLNARTDKRVDEMVDQGLLREMTDFHAEYNQSRLQDQDAPDYTHGIFQSIGFKEFHEYLIMSEEDRLTERGKKALKQGIEDMKRATRQYARRQSIWMVNRFLKRRGSSVPSVYAVDSTDPALWSENVNKPACQVVEAFLEGKDVTFDPLPVDKNLNTQEYNKCEVCDMVLLTSQQWQFHIKGRRHKKNVERQNRIARGLNTMKREQSADVIPGRNDHEEKT